MEPLSGSATSVLPQSRPEDLVGPSSSSSSMRTAGESSGPTASPLLQVGFTAIQVWPSGRAQVEGSRSANPRAPRACQVPARIDETTSAGTASGSFTYPTVPNLDTLSALDTHEVRQESVDVSERVRPAGHEESLAVAPRGRCRGQPPRGNTNRYSTTHSECSPQYRPGV